MAPNTDALTGMSEPPTATVAELPPCIHRRAVRGQTVDCASNRIVPLPLAGGAVRRSLAVCLHPCPYTERPNLAADEMSQRSRRAVEKPDPTPDDFPCVHRGGVTETRECDLCGRRGQLFQVFACGVHRQCSIGTRQRGLKACVACEDQSPDPPGHPQQ